MKAYKIDLTPYETVLQRADGDEKEVKKTVYIKWALPRNLCDPNIGAKQDERNPRGGTRPSEDFDMSAIGPIAQRIEQCQEPYLVVSKEELDTLKKRAKVVCNYFGYSAFEMFRRIFDAQETMLEEAK